MEQKVIKAAFDNIMHGRRSVRGFLNTPIAPTLLQEIFTTANKTPSNCNTQPWISHVVSGEKLEVLRKRMPENVMQGKMTIDHPYESKYPGVYQERQFEAANTLYSAIGIERQDKAKRMEVFLRNYQFFGAPYAVFIFLDESFGLREAADLGMYMQSLLLSMSANGVASVPQTSVSFQADLVREVLGVESHLKLLFGISFGYEDKSAAINDAVTGRAALSENTFFHV